MVGRILLDVDRAVFWICFAFVVANLSNWWKGERQVRQLPDGRVRFVASWSGIAMAAMLATAIPPSVTFIRHDSNRITAISFSCFLVAIAATVFDLPGSIVAGSQGLGQHYWLRRDKLIRWNDIVEIESQRKRGPVTIKSSDGTKIVHGSFLTGRSRLLRELKIRCGKELPEDFPREPLDDA